MEIAYVYNKKRSDFGKDCRPIFVDNAAKPLESNTGFEGSIAQDEEEEDGNVPRSPSIFNFDTVRRHAGLRCSSHRRTAAAAAAATDATTANTQQRLPHRQRRRYREGAAPPRNRHHHHHHDPTTGQANVRELDEHGQGRHQEEGDEAH